MQSQNSRGQLTGRNQNILRVKEEYLYTHFEQISDILTQHYRYGFELMKCLWTMGESQFRNKIERMRDIFVELAKRRKRAVIEKIRRKVKQHLHFKNRACCILGALLIRKVTPYKICLLAQMKQIQTLKNVVPKDKRLFLFIKLSNLNKLIKMQLSAAHHAIRNQANINKQTQTKIQLMKIHYLLSNKMNTNLIDGFHRLAKSGPQDQLYVPVEGDTTKDDESIWVSVYKDMANQYLRSVKRPADHSIMVMKLRTKLNTIFSIIHNRYSKQLKSVFYQILCLNNHRFKRSTMEILQKQISILQQQYQSV